jgi:hypothetical protein
MGTDGPHTAVTLIAELGATPQASRRLGRDPAAHHKNPAGRKTALDVCGVAIGAKRYLRRICCQGWFVAQSDAELGSSDRATPLQAS